MEVSDQPHVSTDLTPPSETQHPVAIGWVGSISGLDVVVKREIFVPAGNRTHFMADGSIILT